MAICREDLAERIADPADRRGYLIRLTPRGLKIVDAVLHRLLEIFRKKLRPMEAVPEGVKLFEESLRLYERCIEQR